MTRFPPGRTLLLLLACIASPVAAAPPVPDIAAEWTRFLAEADPDEAYGALAAPMRAQRSVTEVDPGVCREERDQIQASAAALPVSALVHWVAYRCAEARGEEELAEVHAVRFGAIARHALSQASDDWWAPPIRMVSGRDIDVILAAAGLEQINEIFSTVPQGRYLIKRIQVWDPVAKVERQLAFDWTDVVVTLHRKIAPEFVPTARVDYVRKVLADMAENGSLAAIDLRLLGDSFGKDSARDRVATLRRIAELGGIHAASEWIDTCAGPQAYPGCADGLVDLLLAGAEKEHALPTLKLAIAYARGVGVKKDEAAAMALLDAAQRRWPGAVVDYARSAGDWLPGNAPYPAALAARLEALESAGNPLATVMLSERAGLAAGGAIPADRLGKLQAAAEAGSRAALVTLAIDRDQHGTQAEALPWLRRGADAGLAPLQDRYAAQLRWGIGDGPPDMEGAQAQWLAASRGDDGEAMMALAFRAGVGQRWAEARQWYIAAHRKVGDPAALALAELFLEGHEGLPGPAESVRLYRLLVDEGNTDAMVPLADLLLEGKGVEEDAAGALALFERAAAEGDVYDRIAFATRLVQGRFGDTGVARGEAMFREGMAEGVGEMYDAWATHLYYSDDADLARRREAIKAWEAGLAHERGSLRNNLAWALCTCPEAELRDPARGLDIARDMGDPADLGPNEADTLAACHAAVGDFETAGRLQSAVLARLRAWGSDDESLPGMQARLDDYAAGKAYIERELDAKDAGSQDAPAGGEGGGE